MVPQSRSVKYIMASGIRTGTPMNKSTYEKTEGPEKTREGSKADTRQDKAGMKKRQPQKNGTRKFAQEISKRFK